MDLKNWHIITTRSQREGEAIGDLARHSLITFLPMCRIEAYDRIKRCATIRVKPVFDGYVFAASRGEFDFAALHDSKHVTGFLGSNGRPYIVPEKTISDIIDGQARGVFNVNFGKKNSEVHIGDKVEIKVGALVGSFGRVTSVKGKRLVLMMSEMLCALSEIKIDVDKVARVA